MTRVYTQLSRGKNTLRNLHHSHDHFQSPERSQENLRLQQQIKEYQHLNCWTAKGNSSPILAQGTLQSHGSRNLPVTLRGMSQSHYRDTRLGEYRAKPPCKQLPLTCCISSLLSMLCRGAVDHNWQEHNVAPGCTQLPAPPSSSTQRGLILTD